eukprot:scaffold160175_cov28-Prasinocladus_malaysianus.AAC.1
MSLALCHRAGTKAARPHQLINRVCSQAQASWSGALSKRGLVTNTVTAGCQAAPANGISIPIPSFILSAVVVARPCISLVLLYSLC